MYDTRTARLTVLLEALDRLPGADFADSFNERLILQKTVYLLDAAFQKHGLGSLGYQFGWYVRGPYSSTAADDLFAIAAQPDPSSLRQGLSLNPQGKAAADDVVALLTAPPDAGPDEVQWLELLASLHYLAERFGGARGFEEAWAMLQKTKPSLANATQAQVAWRELTARGFCKGAPQLASA